MTLSNTSLCALCFSFALRAASAWQRWNATSFTSDQWRTINHNPHEGPGHRRGHTLVLRNGSKVVLFGGISNDQQRRHVPSRFNVEEKGGVLEFETYDGHVLSDRYAPDAERCEPVATCAPANEGQVCSLSWQHLLHENLTHSQRVDIESECGFVTTQLMFNDVWEYNVDCGRYSDLACTDDGWRISHPGLAFGGCDGGEEDCNIPSERHGHGAAMLNETSMMIYGGFSHECEDYCEDIWIFDFEMRTWSRHEGGGPGKRWQFSMTSAADSIFVFGGHRLWHGFSPQNSASNRWTSTDGLPEGGYLSDFWQWSNDKQIWVEIEGKETCFASPGLTWESRNDQHCEVFWPGRRSGHAAVYDESRHRVWLHGGYNSYFPYPTNKDEGSGPGTQSLGRQHKAFLPTYQFWLDDLWFYDIESGYWSKENIFGRQPARRSGHILIASGDILILHG